MPRTSSYQRLFSHPYKLGRYFYLSIDWLIDWLFFYFFSFLSFLPSFLPPSFLPSFLSFFRSFLISFFLSFFLSFFRSFSFTMLAKKLQRVVACFKQFAIVVLKLTEDFVSVLASFQPSILTTGFKLLALAVALQHDNGTLSTSMAKSESLLFNSEICFVLLYSPLCLVSCSTVLC